MSARSLFARKPIAELLPAGDTPHSLRRALGAGDLIMLAIGAVIGAGIFGAIGTAAASILTEKLCGLSLAQAAALEMADITAALDADIKPARVKCVMLPLDTLRAGIRAYEQRV